MCEFEENFPKDWQCMAIVNDLIEIKDGDFMETCGKQGFRAIPVIAPQTMVHTMAVLCKFHAAKFETDSMTFREEFGSMFDDLIGGAG
jgi:hypothetical protein